MTSEINRLLGNLQPPSPQPELRDRTLRTAVDALKRRSMPDQWARIWQSRLLRFAWAATVAGLLLAHTLISTTPQSPAVTAQGFALHQVSQTTEDEIQVIATVLRLDLDANALAGSVAAAATPQQTPEPGVSNKKENV